MLYVDWESTIDVPSNAECSRRGKKKVRSDSSWNYISKWKKNCSILCNRATWHIRMKTRQHHVGSIVPAKTEERAYTLAIRDRQFGKRVPRRRAALENSLAEIDANERAALRAHSVRVCAMNRTRFFASAPVSRYHSGGGNTGLRSPNNNSAARHDGSIKLK